MEITIGTITIKMTPSGYYWVTNELGEGTQVGPAMMEKGLKELFDRWM